MTRQRSRQYDLVLFGASGFTGGLTAAYLARHVPDGTRWALAGRNGKKLSAVRDRLAATGSAAALPDVRTADVTDPPSLERLAASARVLINTVGPYLHHGDAVVGACARNGTDYVDISGEPEFVDRSYLRHHATAADSGARLVHACGFDSVPHDLGVLTTVRALPRDVPLTVHGYVQVAGAVSAGTYHSALTSFSRVRTMAATARQRCRAEGRPAGRRARSLPARPGREPRLAIWALPLPTIDPQVVLRSARALDVYGPDFAYGHYVAVRRLPSAVGLAGAVGGLFALAQLPPACSWLRGRMTAGDGPPEQKRADSWFRVLLLGEGGGRRVLTEVSGGDPGYDETSVMVAESALSLAFDALPKTAGQVTPAVAMGDALTERIRTAGITVRAHTL